VKKSTSKKPSQTNWAKIDAKRDDEIDFSDIPEQGKAFFKQAVLRLPQPKAAVTIRLDRQVLQWFKAQGAAIKRASTRCCGPTWKRTRPDLLWGQAHFRGRK